jgi:hypothetical protein
MKAPPSLQPVGSTTVQGMPMAPQAMAIARP